MNTLRVAGCSLMLMWAACSTPPEETVVQTWPSNGQPKEIHAELADGAGTEVRILHENGRIHMRGVLKEGKREGTWNTYREDGMPWSQVQYVSGQKSGLFRTWHPGGIPHIEGQHRAGDPDGDWNFYSTDGQLIQTEHYGPEAN